MTRRPILLLEDDLAVRKTIADLLGVEGFTVVTAKNGKDGISILSSGQIPGLILLDMMMPEMNGWEFMDFTKNNPSFASIPLVIMSAYQETAKSFKSDGILRKPVQLDALIQLAEKFCA